MSFSPHKAWKRLSRMSWDEIRTRLGQEFAKRTDYALSRAGFPLGRKEILGANSRTGNFFFSPEEVPERIALLKKHLASVEEQTVTEANEILEHRFRLLGYRDLDYGTEIDWHLDRVHGKRAPLKPWYKMHFLDFEEVGDHKIIWELNRHQHFVTLAKAWAFTRDEKYLRELSRQFYSWQASNPYPMGINWGSSLEAAFRSLSWLWARQLTAAATGIDPALERDLGCALALHGRHIERYLSTYFSPNTHLIGEAVALFFIGTLCGNLPQAQRWQHQGLRIVLAEAERQVRPDGVYFEQSLYYHVYALDFFLHTRVLAERNQIPLPAHFDAILRRMLEVVRVLSRNGAPEGFGDDDGGRLFNPRRNHVHHLSDPLALGSALGDDSFAAGITEEAVWLLGEPAVASPKSSSALSSAAFRDGGLYVVASENPRAAQMLVDAGPHGIGHGGHGHADALSVRFSSAGRVWLVDPGSYAYISPNHERDRFRGTAAHNTLSVDHLDQAVPDGPFAWRFLPNVEVERWETGSAFTLLEASHSGYQRLSDPVKHRRSIFHWHGDYWLVRDRAEGTSAHQLDLHWHFAPDLRVVTKKNAIVAISPAGEQITLFSSSPGDWDVKVEPGFVSPAYGEKQSAPIGRFSARLELPVEHATLIVAPGAAADTGRFGMAEESVPGATRYVYTNGGTSDSIVFGNGGEWRFGQVSSDAAFLFLRREHDEIESFAFSSASFVELDAHRVFHAPKPISWLDWTRRAGAVASDPQSLKFFRQEILWPRTPVP